MSCREVTGVVVGADTAIAYTDGATRGSADMIGAVGALKVLHVGSIPCTHVHSLFLVLLDEGVLQQFLVFGSVFVVFHETVSDKRAELDGEAAVPRQQGRIVLQDFGEYFKVSFALLSETVS